MKLRTAREVISDALEQEPVKRVTRPGDAAFVLKCVEKAQQEAIHAAAMVAGSGFRNGDSPVAKWGQSCATAIRDLLAQGIDARSGQTACGLDPKGESPVSEADAPQ